MKTSLKKWTLLLLGITLLLPPKVTSLSSSYPSQLSASDIGSISTLYEEENHLSEKVMEEFSLHDSGLVKVVVATTDMDELADFLSGQKYNGYVGRGKSDRYPFSLPIIEVPASLIPKIASLRGVLAVQEYLEPTLSERGAGKISPNMQFVWKHHGVEEAWNNGYRGGGVKIAVVDTGVDFANLDLQGTQARFNASLLNSSIFDERPYLREYDGWPIAFDPLSMSTYLSKGFADDTWYANTTTNGTGPFEASHRIKMDGKNDFGYRERWGSDDAIEVEHILPSGRPTFDFDLQDLYVTRDITNWYFGFSTNDGAVDKSYGLYIDVNNATSGGAYDPLGNFIDTKSSHSKTVNAVAYNPNGSWLASASSDMEVKIWDSNGALIRTLVGHEGFVRSIAWSPDGSKLASADKIAIKIWDASSGALLKTISYPQGTETNSVLAFSPNGTWIAVGGTSNFRIYIFEEATGTMVGYLYPANQLTTSLSFNPNGSWIAVGLNALNDQVRVYVLNSTNINPLGFSTPLRTLSGHSARVLSLSWSPDEQRLSSASADTLVKVWNVDSGTLLADLSDHLDQVNSVNWSKDNRIISADRQGIIKVWSGLTYSRLLNIIASSKPINSVSWSPNNSNFVSASDDTKIKRWNPNLGTEDFVFLHKLPDFVLYLNYTSVLWGIDETGLLWSKNNTFEEGKLFSWTGSTWNSQNLSEIGGSQAYFSFLVNEVVDRGFVEIAIPRIWLGNPEGMAVELFSLGRNRSHAQDTAPTDANVQFTKTDWSSDFTSLSNFAFRIIQKYYVNLSLQNASKSNTYHFGNHPDKNLMREFGAVPILVVDNRTAGKYERVYIDLNGDKIFDEKDSLVYKGREISFLDNFNSTAIARGDVYNYSTPDGYPDISGGMIYFISDGKTPIPYSDVYVERKLLKKNIIPGNGDLVTFMGELNLETNHGTRSASAIVSQGKIDTDPNPEIGPVMGIAPEAKIIPIGNAFTDVFEAWYFAVEGYDGIPGSGDEALIVSNGFNYPLLYNDGWDIYSRFVDYASILVSESRTIFVVSAGNDGYGYGTLSSPASSPGVIAAGVATDFTRYSSQYGGLEGSNSHYGDVEPFSSRGPTPLGNPKPDVVAIGIGTVDEPLSSGEDGSNATTATPWLGSSLSAAVTSGILALIYDAYNRSHAGYPNVTAARSFLMSGSEDMNHDILSQGAGFLNASRSTSLAADSIGISSTPSIWVPGGYQGERAEAFVRVLLPGERDSQTITLRNHGSATVTAEISDLIFRRYAQFSISNSTYRDFWYSTEGAVIVWMNSTGIYQVIPEPTPPNFSNRTLASWDPSIWSEANLLKVTASADLYQLDRNRNSHIELESDYVYSLKLQDWVNTNPYGVPFPLLIPSELNTVSKSENIANVLEARMHDPASRVHDGLVVNIEPLTGRDGILWNMRVEFYKKVDWNWTKLNGQDGSLLLSVGGKNTASFEVTVDVPSNAQAGSYEGAIYIKASGFATVIPILVNVASTGARSSFGGGPPSDDLFGVGEVYGGYGGGLGSDLQQSGDWRFIFLDIPSAGLFLEPIDYRLYLDVTFGLKPTDIDIFVFGKGGVLKPGDYPSSRYGPYSLEVKGKSEEKKEFFTTTNTSREILVTLFSSGLNVIALHNVELNGTIPQESFAGEVGWIILRPTEISISTNSLAGKTEVYLISNMEWPAGIEASAIGPASMERYEDIEIPLDKEAVDSFLNREISFIEALTKGSYTKVVKVENALIFDVHIWGHADSPDLDLGIFLDSNGDGIAQVSEFIKYDADADADEHVKLTSPANGQYIIKVLGFDTSDPGHFDIEISITIAGVKGYKVEDVPQGWIPPFTTVSFNMTWDFLGNTLDREYGGALTLGPPEAPSVILIPVSIAIDRSPPTITGFSITAIGFQVNEMDNRTTNDQSPVLAVTFEDLERGELDWRSVKVFLDDVDVTGLSSISVPFFALKGILGFWSGYASYTPPYPLKDGVYSFDVKVADKAGNFAEKHYLFVIDSLAPKLLVEGPSTIYTNQSRILISGEAEPGSTVFIREATILADSSGVFKTELTLVEGINEIEIKAVDWFDIDSSGRFLAGNSFAIRRTIIYDIYPPSFSSIITSSGSPTNKDNTIISGVVEEKISSGQIWDPTTVQLTINGRKLEVHSDGAFSTMIALKEGSNQIAIEVVDAAGNKATALENIFKDTSPPSLTVEPFPEVVSEETLTLKGSVEVGAFLAVNGKPVIPSANGSFSSDVSLSLGDNIIILEATDSAGNVQQVRKSVIFSPVRPVDYTPYALGSLLLVLAVLFGYFIALKTTGPKEKREETKEERMENLKKAYEEGLISKESYERDLARLELEEETPEGEGEEVEKATKEEIPMEKMEALPLTVLELEQEMRRWEEEGFVVSTLKERLQKDPWKAGTYLAEFEENVRRSRELLQSLEFLDLRGLEARAEEIRGILRNPYEIDVGERKMKTLKEEIERRGELTVEEERIAKLKMAFEEGKISRELYEKNLERLEKRGRGSSP